MSCDDYQELTGANELVLRLPNVATIQAKIAEILRFPHIVPDAIDKEWVSEFQKFSGSFACDAWSYTLDLPNGSSKECHMDALYNFVLWYDWVPVCYTSFGYNSTHIVIQTLQWIWKNPKKISEFDWQATLVWMVEQFSREYLLNRRIGLIKTSSHPFGEKLQINHYENIAARLGFDNPETIDRPLWLLYYTGNSIDILSKSTRL